MPPETIGALNSFLQWGAVGLAGLMLVLVIIALVTGKFSTPKERTLKYFMTTGAICFLAALAAEFFSRAGEYRIEVVVLPNDLDTSPFPPPRIRVNGTEVNRIDPIMIATRSTLTIDVTSALGVFAQKEQQVVAQAAEIAAAERLISEQTNALSNAQRTVEQISTELSAVRTAIDTSRSPAAMPSIDGIDQDLRTLHQSIGGVIRLAP